MSLARRTPLRTRTPIRRRSLLRTRKPINRRRSRPRRSPYPRDPARLAWLRGRPCRAPGVAPHPSGDAHHLRHTSTGAGIGARLKNDSRAISLCRICHGHIELGTGPWAGWTRDEIRAWENRQVVEQAAEYEAQLEGP
jgi:hypothetical protein